jgi:hypothetical protein
MTQPRPRARRPIASSLVAAGAMLAATFVPAATASAQTPSWNQANACPSGEVPSSGFADATGVHGRAIDCLSWYQLTAGRTATSYGTQEPVRRDQTASFIVRTLQRVDEVAIPPRERGAFPDISSGVHVANVETLAGFDPQIVAGFDDGTFRPARALTRAQFASITTRMLDELADQGKISRLPNASSPFRDTAGSVHERNIARLANAGIVAGRDRNTFAPQESITRGQIASIITRILGGLVDQELVLQPLELSGVVHDAEDVRPDELGDRIAGATVEVSGVANTTTTTNGDGVYSVWLQQPGTSTMEVRATGFQTREVTLDLPDENVEDGLDIGMYRPANAPDTALMTGSTGATSVGLSNDGLFWVISLGFDASAADEIVLEYPNGIAIALGAAGTSDAWFSRNPDGTSNRVGQDSGTHSLYYRFGDVWRQLDATFDGEGRLVEVNGTPYVPGA